MLRTRFALPLLLQLRLGASLTPATTRLRAGVSRHAVSMLAATHHDAAPQHGSTARAHQLHHAGADEDPSIYFVMGGPGSGKGTQCEKLVEEYGMVHLSAGDLLRAEVRSGSEEGQKIARVIKEGKIVVSETTVGLLRKAMAGSKGPFLIDGFPRSLENLQAFEEAISPCKFMLFLEVSEAEMEQRLMKRGLSSGRSDDNAETIRKRFRTFLGESMPVIDVLEERGVVHRVSAEASPEEVFSRVSDAFAEQPLAPSKAAAPSDYAQLLSPLAAGDAAALLIFAAIGRGNHDTATGNVLTTAAPFLLSWAALAPPLGAYAGRRPATLREAATAPVLAWAVAVPCGCALRGVLNDRMPAAPFWIVALVATGVLLEAWRLAYHQASGVSAAMDDFVAAIVDDDD